MAEGITGPVQRFLTLANETFTSYIIGQITEAVILGTLCGAGMFILRLPYALMTGVIVGSTALIPVMGAYIGAFVGTVMILTINPLKALEFLIYIAILQQVEGNLMLSTRGRRLDWAAWHLGAGGSDDWRWLVWHSGYADRRSTHGDCV